MNCGAATEEAKAAEVALADMTDEQKKTFASLAKMDWGAPKEFKDKKGAVEGKIWKADLAGFSGTWVKADKVFKGVSKEDWHNYNKFLAETLKTDKTIKAAESTSKNDDGTVNGLYVEMAMGMMVSNRDAHYKITRCKMPADIKVDDCKADEVTIWSDHEKPKAEKKKVVRMKVLSFCLNFEVDGGFRTIDFDNYDFGGSLPTSVVNKFVGNSADYVTIAGYLANIKKNNGVFKK